MNNEGTKRVGLGRSGLAHGGAGYDLNLSDEDGDDGDGDGCEDGDGDRGQLVSSS